jgi:hypothetical protein
MGKSRLLGRRVKISFINAFGRLLVRLFRSEFNIFVLLKSKFGSNLSPMTNVEKSDEDFVIVIQGPIDSYRELNYLTKTLEIYRDIFPNAKIIISSYFFSKYYLDKINPLFYDEIVLNDDVDLKTNFEKQVFSSFNGILASKKFNRKYVIKSRVDQRFSHTSTLLYFRFLLEAFPTNKGRSRTRILGSSCNSWLYRPLGISDMLIAGTLEDLLKYWRFDSSITQYSLKDCIENFDKTWLNQKSLHFESFLAARYLAECGFVFGNDGMDDNYKMWRDFMLVADAQDIAHEWKKRNSLFVGNSLVKFGYGANPDALKEISFVDWLSLYRREFRLGKIVGYEDY